MVRWTGVLLHHRVLRDHYQATLVLQGHQVLEPYLRDRPVVHPSFEVGPSCLRVRWVLVASWKEKVRLVTILEVVRPSYRESWDL